MKRILCMAVIASALACGSVQAQETTSVDMDVPCTEMYTHDWKKNWYLQLSAGGQMFYFEKGYDSNFDLNKTTGVYGLGLGHWFSPYFGYRFNVLGGAVHYDNFGWKKFKNVNLNIDLTWDMFNTLGGVNDKRVFSIVPYIGLGTAYAWDYDGVSTGNISGKDNTSAIMDNQWALVASLGLEFRFRVHKNVDIFVDTRFKGMSENFNNIAWGAGIEPGFSVMGGLTFNLNKEGRQFKTVNPCDYTAAIRDLNDKVNNMRRDLDEANAKLKACESRKPEVQVKEVVKEVPSAPAIIPAIRFNINSAQVSNADKATLYDVAEMMKKDEDVKVVIKGYADKKTGTADYNRRLSEKRAENVRDILVDYGVDESRISTQGLGADEQPYSNENKWNRVALIIIQ